MQISESYRKQNAQLHEGEHYGTSGKNYASYIRQLAGASQDILDYGCGKKTLEQALGFKIHNYDPCIPELDARPQPAHIVARTDVLEHVEPECLDAVLDDIQRLVRGFGFFTIATGPAKKDLPDGRNAHLIQERLEWWLPKLWTRFNISEFANKRQQIIVIVTPK